ncbi:fucolectin-like [Mercenaria mercenaria]|uniref:fucolectin-like n=1 Tax=Mercenaria mercenaria TaxID=6596 RepID=UPI00234FB2F3|nr:fucolectin-like [Mercenaria mercenaria]
MEITVFNFVIVIFNIFGRFCSVKPTSDFIQFRRINALDGITCQASQNMFNVTEVQSGIKCSLLCTEAQACVGVFHQAQTKECFGCSSFTADETLSRAGTRFYGRVPGTNVAEGKQTTMSSVSSKHVNYGGDKGVDGITNQDLWQGFCFHTEYESSPWWRVDLGAKYGIFSVKLYNILNSGGVWKARDLRLSIGITLETMDIVGSVLGQIDDIHTFNFSAGIEGRYVQVTLMGANVLHLCEIQVFGFSV